MGILVILVIIVILWMAMITTDHIMANESTQGVNYTELTIVSKEIVGDKNYLVLTGSSGSEIVQRVNDKQYIIATEGEIVYGLMYRTDKDIVRTLIMTKEELYEYRENKYGEYPRKLIKVDV